MILKSSFTQGAPCECKGGTHITYLSDIEDMHLLSHTKREDLPLLIDRKWGIPGFKLYKKLIAGEVVNLSGHDIVNRYQYVYHTSPRDDWGNWIEVYFEDLLADPILYAHIYDAFRMVSEFTKWEGDIREGPFVSVLPKDEDSQTYVVAFKQDNNGETFYCSPVPLSGIRLSEDLAHNPGGYDYLRRQR